MKISLLKQLIKEELSKPPMSTLAGFVRPHNTRAENKILVVYNPIYLLAQRDKLENPRLAEELRHNFSEEGIVAYLNVGPTPPKFGPCNNSWMIFAIAAQKGYGKIPYGFATQFSPTGYVIPDRDFVSSEANEGWFKQYSSQRARKPLDNIRAPKTPPPEDDCLVYPPPDDFLNNSFGPVTPPVSLDTLTSNHIATISQINADKASIESILYSAGVYFFTTSLPDE
jgi:hypothetical protein